MNLFDGPFLKGLKGKEFNQLSSGQVNDIINKLGGLPSKDKELANKIIDCIKGLKK
jgi:hypothetical protein